jgi:hypothetical protein
MKVRTSISPKALFKKQMNKVRVQFMKEIEAKKVDVERIQEKKQQVQDFLYKEKLRDIKEFKKEYIKPSKPLPKGDPQFHLTLEKQSQRRKDQLLSLYYASQDFVTYDNLRYKIEMTMQHPKKEESVPKRLSQMRQRVDSKYNTIMDQHSTTSNRATVLKKQLMNTIRDQPGQYQIEEKQGERKELESIVKHVQKEFQ